jgi:hypothetical protein
LGNFVSHCFYYLEWLCGPIAGLTGRLFALPGTGQDSSIALALAFASGAGGSLQMSCASFLGSGHRRVLRRGRRPFCQSHRDYRGFDRRTPGVPSLQAVATEAARHRSADSACRPGGAAGAASSMPAARRLPSPGFARATRNI